MNSMQARVGERGIDLADRLPRDIRSVVHEYGLSVVMALYNNGVRTPSAMREVLRCVFLGAREPGNKRPGSHVLPHLDTFLVSAGSHLTAGQIIRAIRDGGYTVLPLGGATNGMLKASMATVANGNLVVSKSEKHKRRLQAAINAGDRELWGTP